MKNKDKRFIGFIFVLLLVVCVLSLTACGKTEKEDYSYEDAKTSKVGCLLGSTTSIFLNDKMPEAELFQYNALSDGVTALKSGKIDYLGGSEKFLGVFVQRTDGLKILDDIIISADLAFGLQKNNTELADEISGVLNEYRENGKLDEMINHWVDCNNYPDVDIPVNTTGETIVVATTGEGEPHTFIYNDKLTGIDVEIIGNILYDLGYQVEYKLMAFGALIPALESGKIDVIASYLSVTEERKKTICYTDPYIVQHQKFAVRTDRDSGESFSVAGFFENLKEDLHDNLIKESRYKLILSGLKMTLALAVTSLIFGTLFGMILVFMRRSRLRAPRIAEGVFSAIVEGTPMVVILMIVCYIILGKADVSGIIVGMIAFGMVFANDVCGAIENGLNNVEKGQYEAVAALGYPKWQGFRQIILPQLMRNFLPVYRRSMTTMIKATAIAGYVAIQDLTKAGDIIRSRTFDAFVPLIIVAVIYFIIIWLITLLLQWFEHSSDRKRRKREVKL